MFLSSPSPSFPPQVLLPCPGFAIQMRTGMLQCETKATDTIYLIQLKKGYWVLKGKWKKKKSHKNLPALFCPSFKW